MKGPGSKVLSLHLELWAHSVSARLLSSGLVHCSQRGKASGADGWLTCPLLHYMRYVQFPTQTPRPISRLHGEERDRGINYLCLKVVQMEKQIKMFSFELGSGAPPALRSSVLQQRPDWQNPEYSHHPPTRSRDRAQCK